MTVGSLTARIVLDQPARIHRGTDPVTGSVLLTYRCPYVSSPVELFGPLEVIVNFHGRAKTKIVVSSGKDSRTVRGRVPLFAIARKIHDGPFRISPNKTLSTLFSLNFPAAIETRRSGAWKPDPIFSSDGILPPTLAVHHRGRGRRFDCFTEYRIGVTVRMPGINIKILGVSDDAETHVLYEQPRTTQHAILAERYVFSRDQFAVQNEHLLPEADRPTGFKQKTKALFHANFYPAYPFGVSVSFPRHVYIGQPMRFQIEIRPLPLLKEWTTEVVSQINKLPFLLESYCITLTSTTHVRAERPTLSFSEPSAHAMESMLIGMQPARGLLIGAGRCAHTVETRSLADVPSTFSTVNIRRTYALRFRLVLTVAGEEFKVVREHPVIVLSPIDVGAADAGQEAGSSATMQDPGLEDLPLYEASAQPGPSNGTQVFTIALSGNDAPPEYQSAAGVLGDPHQKWMRPRAV